MASFRWPWIRTPQTDWEKHNPKQKMNEARIPTPRDKAKAVFRALSSSGSGGQPSDPEFDEVFTPETRQLSSDHWTPVEVALCAAEMLVASPQAKVLDVGCGPGKFCLIGALKHAVPFAGIDQRPHLLAEGRAIASRAKIRNLEFIHGNMVDLDWSAYNAFYLYNPFSENVSTPAIDGTVPLKPEYYSLYVAVVQQKLMGLPVGTRVVTYHGFGGEMPYGYRIMANRKIGSGFLQSWIKESDSHVTAGGRRAMVWPG
jgi:SAM-dependent methyltransferase